MTSVVDPIRPVPSHSVVCWVLDVLGERVAPGSLEDRRVGLGHPERTGFGFLCDAELEEERLRDSLHILARGG